MSKRVLALLSLLSLVGCDEIELVRAKPNMKAGDSVVVVKQGFWNGCTGTIAGLRTYYENPSVCRRDGCTALYELKYVYCQGSAVEDLSMQEQYLKLRE